MTTILGVDYGTRRVGLAVSDPSGSLALALRTIQIRGERDAVEQVCAAAGEAGAGRIVVGLPVNMNGTLGAMAEAARAFAARLAEASGLPVETCDERLSTSEAERVLLEADLSRGKRRELRDKLAARIILQSYLDGRAIRGGAEGGAAS